MRRLATFAAVMAFFAMAIVGWLSEQSIFTCAMRALVGAAVLFVVVLLAGRIALRIMVDAVLKARWQASQQRAARDSQGKMNV